MKKMNPFLIVLVIILFAGIGIYIGLVTEQQIQISDDTKLETVSKKEAIPAQEPSKIQTSGAKPIEPGKKHLSYKEELFSDPVVKSLKLRTKEIFKNYSFAEEISDWMAIGVVMDDSQNFGKIYLGALSELNKNPEDVLNALEKEAKKLTEKDSFIRNMFLNLGHNLNVSENEKRGFFGSEITRKVNLDDKGHFTEDSMNITNAMALFRQHSKSDKDALGYAKKALELNSNDPQIQKELLLRIKSYFPQIISKLEQ